METNQPSSESRSSEIPAQDDRRESLLAKGQEHYQAGDLTQARRTYETLLGDHADEVHGWVQLALVCFKQEDFPAFEAALEKAFELDPAHYEALRLLGNANFLAGKFKPASFIYGRMLKDQPDDVEILHAMGVCLFKHNLLDEAADMFHHALEVDPDNELAQDNLRAIRESVKTGAEPAIEKTEPVDSKLDALEQAEFFYQSGNQVAAIEELERALSGEPENPKFIEALGSLRYQKGDLEESRQLFRRLVELQPRNPSAYTRLAMAAIGLGLLEEFESAVGLALEMDPDNPDTLRFLAKINLEQERYLEAGQFYLQALQKGGDDLETLLALGKCLAQGGETEVAVEAFEHALELDPENTIALENLAALTPSAPPLSEADALQSAQTAADKEDWETAQRELEAGLIAQPGNGDLIEALGKLHLHREHLSAAREQFEKLTALRPDSADAWTFLAIACQYQQDDENCGRALERALAIDPVQPDALRIQGNHHFRAGEYEKASEYYDQILPGRSDDVETRLALGVCHFKTGNANEARSQFEAVLEIAPDNALAHDNLKALENAPNPSESTSDSPANDEDPLSNEDNPDLPRCAQLGGIKRAHEQVTKGNHIAAWNICLAAIEARPFHPDAWLQMVEIALDAKDENQAMITVKRLLELTPEWDVPTRVHESLKAQKNLAVSNIDWPALPNRREKPQLTVCMIVKDEEQFLDQCLDSIRPIAHQVVVVDTGSTDRTMDIAREHGAEVHQFEWNDNFSDARNCSLEHARGDWVLILDADETLPADSHAALTHDMAKHNQLGLRIPLQNMNETADGTCFVPRLFRNAPGLCFVGRVHEQVYYSLIVRKNHWQMEASMGTATIQHFGYDPEVKADKDKVQRNLRLLERAVEEIPSEPALLMNYGLDLFNDGQVEKAMEQYRKAVHIMEQHPAADVLPEVRERLMTIYSCHLLQAEHFEELIDLAETQLAKDTGPTASIHFVAGLALINLDRHDEAIPHLRACLDKLDNQVYTPAVKGLREGRPHHLLADCLSRSDESDAADQHYQAALELDPESTGIRHEYARYLVRDDRAAEAMTLLHTALEGAQDNGDSSLWALGCNIVNGHLEDSDVALNWTKVAIESHPEHSEIRKQRGIALLTAGQFTEAQPFFEDHPLGLAHVTEAALFLCQLTTDQEVTPVAPAEEEGVSCQVAEWYRRMLVHRQIEAVDAIADRLEVVEKHLPTAGQILRETIGVVED